MPNLDDVCFDVVTGLNIGKRERQEDAVIADFPLGSPLGFAVLSDGMGGHASGDVASGIVVTELFSELKMLAENPVALEANIGDALQAAVVGANDCIRLYEKENPNARGMGATLVAPILFGNRLYWVSIGDSPLFLFRGGRLFRLNEDHSYAAQIDELHARGVIPLEEALNHPDRSCLISVMSGGQIAKVDYRTEPMRLQEGDILLAASDGLLSLTEKEISEVLSDQSDASSQQVGAALMLAVHAAGDPEQDNLSICLIKVQSREAMLTRKPDEDAEVCAVEDRSEDESQLASEVMHIDRTARAGRVHTVLSLSRKVRNA
ncbi:serine/threonine-protein phosphatase [Shimia sp. R9_2]|uniref:PP2C family protein-serine/threonine phosphatase n=1 Tax=Shimia sp. R9_2 TaxID=2821112 RepID=UPI001AD96475|nr:protein phosphatase 2C domain-containing protein [Shimia sp. R9_2]MBO9398197.1 serine/threonine-protein phosphatase [Shimia sp. R9_2]